jgi:nitrate reductase NapD
VNLSGILVVAKADAVTTVVESLNGLAGLDVHQVDEPSGRIIVVQEAADISAEIAGLKRIKALPNVVMAEMVYHYPADDTTEYEGIPPELVEEAPSEACAVPAYLND